MNKLITVFLYSLFAMSIANATEKLPIHKHQLLSKARLSLIKAGWEPYVIFNLVNKPEEVNLIERQYIRAGYGEVGNCGASTPYCVFNYKKNEKCLQIVAGSFEEPIKTNTVEKWSYECERYHPSP
jgi:hypothetical protein